MYSITFLKLLDEYDLDVSLHSTSVLASHLEPSNHRFSPTSFTFHMFIDLSVVNNYGSTNVKQATAGERAENTFSYLRITTVSGQSY